MGDVVRVKDGFARNFLLPKGKALRATNDNRERFERMKVDLEARNLEQQGRGREGRPASSTARASRCCARRPKAASFTARCRRATSPTLIDDDGFEVDRIQIALNAPIKTIGQHKVPIALHPEVEVAITVNVARNADEAERLARGEDVTVRRDAVPKRKREPRRPSSRRSNVRSGRQARRGRGRR